MLVFKDDLGYPIRDRPRRNLLGGPGVCVDVSSEQMMTKRILTCAAILLGCLAQIAFALPDLVISQLDISPAAPTAGSLVTITASVENCHRSERTGAFFVRFSIDSQEIDLVPLTSLRGGQVKEVTTTWTASAGPHVLTVEVDGPLDRVEESDEQNNERSLTLEVQLDEATRMLLSPFKLAVVRFEDVSQAGFANVGQGVADKLIERLRISGLRVVNRVELDALMQTHGLNPAIPADAAIAGQLIGADLVILGSILGVDVQESSLQLAFLRVDSASVDIHLSAQIIDAHNSQALAAASADGQHEGTTGFSINVGELLSFLSAGTSEICSGGLQVDRAWHNPGQSVRIGYRNEGTAGWYGVEIYSSTGAFLKWLGWQFIAMDACDTWSWDQRNTAGIPTAPGIYTAKLWDGTSHIDSVAFQIRPGISLSSPAADEITVGSAKFDTTVVGTATNHAIDQLTSVLLFSLEGIAAQAPTASEMPLGAAHAMGMPQEGQIAAILPDGRIAINLGASSGITTDDIFEVLAVEDLVLDPETSEVLSYTTVSSKGEIRIIEVREQVSYASMIDGFTPVIGDIVRQVR